MSSVKPGGLTEESTVAELLEVLDRIDGELRIARTAGAAYYVTTSSDYLADEDAGATLELGEVLSHIITELNEQDARCFAQARIVMAAYTGVEVDR